MPYKRDKRSPVPKNETVSRVMSRNRATNTQPEVLLRKHLWHSGLRGYRINYKHIPGRPDIAFTHTKLAIFINGCYWHRCPKCDLPLPKTNTHFWQAKFERNTTRDALKTQQLIALGWTVLTVWECEIKKDIDGIIQKVKSLLPHTAI